MCLDLLPQTMQVVEHIPINNRYGFGSQTDFFDNQTVSGVQ